MDIENEHIKTNLTYKYINNFTKDTDFRGKRFKRYTEKIKDIVLFIIINILKWICIHLVANMQFLKLS